MANLAALQLRRILSSAEAAASTGTLWTLEFSSLALSAHAVRRLPAVFPLRRSRLDAETRRAAGATSSALIAFSHDGGCASSRRPSYAAART